MLSPTTSALMGFIMALMAMAFYTLVERKFLGYFQIRKGPNKPMIIGLPVPICDAIKLFAKEQNKPSMSNNILFMAAPIMGLFLAVTLWLLYPHQFQTIYMPLGMLLFLCMSSMNVYSLFLAGWCSNSKYSLLGSLRGIAQTISYEVSMAMIMLSALMLNHTLDLSTMANNQYSWMAILLPPVAAMWLITCLAETNRTPFDFAEGESELVSGFNTEFSSGTFAMIFMAEYMNILIMSLLTATLFCGSLGTMNSFMLIAKTMLFATFFVWARATLPRLRYDHLMYLTWKSFLPIIIGILMLILPISMLIE